MKKLSVAILSVLIASCASQTPKTFNQFNVKDNSASYLENGSDKGNEQFTTKLFQKYNGQQLEGSLASAPVKNVYIIPSGKSDLCVRINWGGNVNGAFSLYSADHVFSVNAESSKRYHIAASIDKNDVTFGIVDQNGKEVSEKVSKVLTKKDVETGSFLVPFSQFYAIGKAVSESKRCSE